MTESMKQGAKKVSSAGQSAANSSALTGLARVGLVAYGVVHVLVAWIAVQLAWSSTAQSADKSGALGTLADDPLGRVLLWVIAIGLFALVIWQLSEAMWGFRGEDGKKRLRHRITAAVKAIIFGALAISAIRAATGSNSSDAAAQQQQTSGVLSLPYGQFLVVAVGLIVMAVGIAHIIQGIRKKFMKHIDKGMSSKMRSAVEKVGVAGYIARGIALILVGAILGYAAITFDPAKATGLDGALRLIVTAPFGRILLTLVAAGFLAYGLFAFARARYEDL
ncbi:MAG: DUF1206 domain-containing protein [Actinomycetota bacterium]|nr:DUF1206 domain-containing protein [Actinomycetota bacterium]